MRASLDSRSAAASLACARGHRRAAAAASFRPPTIYRVAALVFIFALAGVGLNLLMGFAGQVSLGHAGFFGIGAYAVAIGPTHLGLPSWAVARRRRGLSGAPRLRRRPADPAPARATISRSPRSASASCRHRVHQRSALHRRAGRHVGAAARRCSAGPCAAPRPGTGSPAARFLLGAAARAQPDRQPDRPRAARDPRQRDRGARARHRRRAQQARGVRGLGGLCLGRGLLSRAAQRPTSRRTSRASCARSSSSPWWCSAAWARSSARSSAPRSSSCCRRR